MNYSKNPANGIKDLMWSFLMDHGQKANIPELKEAVYELIQATTQKDAGQRGKVKNVNWDDLEMIFFHVVIESTALVLSGELDKLEGVDDGTGKDKKRIGCSGE